MSDVELYGHYGFKVVDDKGWVEVGGEEGLPAFAYKDGVASNSISYIAPGSNLTLITFTC